MKDLQECLDFLDGLNEKLDEIYYSTIDRKSITDIAKVVEILDEKISIIEEIIRTFIKEVEWKRL